MGLEKAAAMVSIISLVVAAFFFSATITGNAIGDLSNSSANILGTSLIIVGLAAGFFYFKRKKRE